MGIFGPEGSLCLHALMLCTSVSSLCVRWSVNEVQASEGQIDPDGWWRGALQLVESLVVAVDIYG